MLNLLIHSCFVSPCPKTPMAYRWSFENFNFEVGSSQLHRMHCWVRDTVVGVIIQSRMSWVRLTRHWASVLVSPTLSLHQVSPTMFSVSYFRLSQRRWSLVEWRSSMQVRNINLLELLYDMNKYSLAISLAIWLDVIIARFVCSIWNCNFYNWSLFIRVLYFVILYVLGCDAIENNKKYFINSHSTFYKK